MHKNYICKDGNILEYCILEDDKDKYMFKVNLPDTKDCYILGNGEGVWCCCSKEDYEMLLGNKPHLFMVRVLNDSVYYPKLVYGTDILVEYRGNNRPVAVIDELQSKYQFSLKNKLEALEIISKYRSVCNLEDGF